MMEFLKKYNIYIFIAIVFLLTIYDFLNWGSLSLVRKLVNLFAALFLLHEIEEKYWPGGFHELMLGKMKLDIDDVDLGISNLYVFIFLMIYLGLAYLFDKIIFFFIMIIALSVFEALIHTVGIKIHKLKKPYTPGLITAWILAIVAIYSIIQLNAFALAAPFEYIIGIVLFIISFLILSSRVYSSVGIDRAEMMKRMRQ